MRLLVNSAVIKLSPKHASMGTPSTVSWIEALSRRTARTNCPPASEDTALPSVSPCDNHGET
jgi:hypothetical protein